MLDQQNAFPLSAPMLEKHYKDVASFQEARAKSARLLSKGAVVGLVISMLGNVGLCWAVASMLPLTKLVPVYLVVRADGTIDSSPALSALPPSSDQAVIRAALWQYVQMREAYSYDTAKYRYDIVSGMSDANTRAAYQQYFNYPNPQSPQVKIGKNGVVTVEPISVALIGPNVAQIRYERSLSIGTDAAITTTWTATEEFEQVDTLPASERLNNPGGIVVTNYQNEGGYGTMRGMRSFFLGVAVLSGGFTTFAFADQTPMSGSYDTRMRYVAYNPGQVVHLSTIVGATMVVSFSQTESVTSVAETDTLHLAAVPKGNFLFLKPSAVLPLQPIIVLTQRQDGSLRRYVFEIETVTDPTTANGADGVFYSVQFTYPADEAVAYAAAAAAQAAKTAQLNQIALANAAHTAATSILDNQRTNPFVGPRNYRYVARGDNALTPLTVWDNGYSTVLQFPGNTRIPSVFVIDPDGKEATASYAVDGNTVQVGQTARELRLRDGNTVLNIYNLGYNTIGDNPGTGTTSASVQRIVTRTPDTFSGGTP